MPRKPKELHQPQLGLDALLSGAAREGDGRRAQGEGDVTGSRAPELEEEPVLSVFEVVSQASRALETRFQSVWVEGEVSNLRRITAGHLFFSLKDDRAQLPAVIFRGDAARLRFRLEDGLAVRCRGTLRIYEAQGKLQLYVDRVEPVGLGSLMLALEQLKRRLAAEGLFDERRKRPLPAFPRRVGVVTSPTGAALRDIIDVIQRRFPVPILVSPAAVQGPEAPAQIVAALGRLVSAKGVDVIIVGRGGGSMEDLWCWNDEAVVRAVAACPIPTVSAVGHEIDHTLCDLAADLRAPTPSAAAERVVPDRREVRRRLYDGSARVAAATWGRLTDRHLALSRLGRRLGDPRPRLLDARASMEFLRSREERAIKGALKLRRQALGVAKERVALGHPRARLSLQRARLVERGRMVAEAGRTLLRRRRDALGSATRRLEQEGRALMEPARRRFSEQAARLDALSPLAVLSRGYAVAVGESGRVLRMAREARVGESLRLRLSRGELGCTVDAVVDPPGGSENLGEDEQEGSPNASSAPDGRRRARGPRE
ncbi:MAG: exodeoxyribonuclease VII large subunit [Polyangia bacterium]|jgi:exodeoxyribonuclease VII large subunit|nr:exodeoxyribonuclease VII large subunit [Polyangia bacterium]